jgi:AraC-like DNA-binding protein
MKFHKGEFDMWTHDQTIKFRNPIEFFDEIMEKGRITDTQTRKFLIYETPFASIESEAYSLFNNIELSIFKIHPNTDINIQYEFDDSYFEVEYIYKGNIFLSENGCEGRVYNSKHLLISPLENFRGQMFFRKSQPSESIAFHATKKVLAELLGDYGDNCRMDVFKRDNSINDTFSPLDVTNAFLQITTCNYPNPIKRLFFESKFLEIITRIMGSRIPSNETYTLGKFETEQIKKIPEILMRRIDNPPSIPELARELSLSATNMKSGFKKIFDTSIYAYYYNMRLEYATTMLLNTNKSVFEIAIDTGYSNSGNFCNAFKKHYGVSPSQYRKNGKLPYETPNLQGLC